MLSLTPRETSSGLRPPRVAASPRLEPEKQKGRQTHNAPPPTSRSRKIETIASVFDEVVVPSREDLLRSTRILQERRVQKSILEDALPGKLLSDSIRERTRFTLEQAHAEPDSANVFAAREIELQRQRVRLEDLRREYDVLHAEWIGKMEMNDLLQMSHKHSATAKRAAAAPPPPPRAESPCSGDGSTTGRGHGRQQQHGHARPIGGGAAFDSDVVLELQQRVDEAQEDLREMLRSCETLAYMEHRTSMSNTQKGSEIEELRYASKVLDKEEATIRALGVDAAEAVRGARRQLSEAHEARAEQARAFDDLKSQRLTVAKERKAKLDREKGVEESERHAKLDGQGELDAEAEDELRRRSIDASAARAAVQLDKEAALREVSEAHAIFQKLRRVTHDPEAISTPQDLYETMLSAKDRGLELQAQVDRTEELSVQLAAEKERLAQDLQNFMYYGSSSLLLADAERDLIPGVEAATELLDARRKRNGSVKELVHECKVGLTMLLNLALGEPTEKLPSDAEIPNALERFERHMTSCLGAINQAATNREARARVMASIGMTSEMEAEAPTSADDAGNIKGRPPRSPRSRGATPRGHSPSAAPHAPHPPAEPRPTGSTLSSALNENRFANNLRVRPPEEIEAALAMLSHGDPEGYDDDGKELHFTRRSRRAAPAPAAAAPAKGKSKSKGGEYAAAPKRRHHKPTTDGRFLT